MVKLFYKNWWKYVTMLTILGVVISGLLISVPNRPFLRDTIRNFFFHVPMWFGMILLLLVSLIYSIRYLSQARQRDDRLASCFTHAGLVMGILGLITGYLWGVYTWTDGDWSDTTWITSEPRLLEATLVILVYLAYFVLRGSIKDVDMRARVSAVYGVFGYAMAIMFIFVVPRLPGTDSLHPGIGGNPAGSEYDLDNSMRRVFYPAIIGWTALGAWLASLRYRTLELESTAGA
jgi:heme exporter protein C